MVTRKDIGKYVEIDLDVYGGPTIPGSTQDLIYGRLEDITDTHYVLRPSAKVEIEILDISDIRRTAIRARGNSAPPRRLTRGNKNLIAHLDQNKQLALSREVVGESIVIFEENSFKRNYGINPKELP